MAKMILIIAAVNGLLAVAIGAFGAHGLKARLSEDLLVVYQTGVQYHFYHIFALALVGLLLLRWPETNLLNISAYCFMIGILLFSGSLYVLAITGIRWLGAITPLGGLAFIVGWLLMAVGIYQST